MVVTVTMKTTESITQEQPTKILQTSIRPSVWRRLRMAAGARGFAGVGPVVDEILDANLPALPAGAAEEVDGEEPAPEPKRKRTA